MVWLGDMMSGWRRWIGLAGLLCLGIVGCKEAAFTWPTFPRSQQDIERLTKRFRHPAATRLSLDLDDSKAMWKRIEGASLAHWRVGWTDVVAWIGHRLEGDGVRYLLWGVYHDSGGQIDAFRRLLGPGGSAGWDLVAMEVFAADGQWQDLSVSAQAGDDSALWAFGQTGDVAVWKQLQGRQERLNYTAWKYGYVPSVMSVLTTLREREISLYGCDMPTPMQQKLSTFQKQRPGLRELHCVLSIQRRLREKKRHLQAKVAVMWGMEHVKPSGFRRWLPKRQKALSIYVLGHRPGSHTPEARLSKKLVLLAPALLPVSDDQSQALLLLPDQRLGGQLDRVRTSLPRQLPQSLLVLSSDLEGVFTWRATQIKLPKSYQDVTLAVAPGCGVFRLQSLSHLWIGSMCVSIGGKVVLSFDQKRRSVRLEQWLPPGEK